MSKTPCSTIVGGKPCGDDLEGIETITSADGSVVIVNPNGPSTDLSAVAARPDVQDNGATQVVDPAFLNFVFSGSIQGAIGESPAGTAKIEIGSDGAPVTNTAPETTGTANAVGTGVDAAREDHVHETGLGVQDETIAVGVAHTLNFLGTGVVANAPIAGVSTIRIEATPPPNSAQVTRNNFVDTNSAVGVLLPGMTITPVAGTYLVNFSASFLTTVLQADGAVVLRVGGVTVAESERNHEGLRADARTCLAIAGYIVAVNGAQAIEVFYRVSSGIIECAGPRSLSIVVVS